LRGGEAISAARDGVACRSLWSSQHQTGMPGLRG